MLLNACKQVKLLKRHSLSNRARHSQHKSPSLETGKKMKAAQNRSSKPRSISAKGKIRKYLGLRFVSYQWGVFQVGFRCRVFFRLVVHDLIPIWHKASVRMRRVSSTNPGIDLFGGFRLKRRTCRIFQRNNSNAKIMQKHHFWWYVCARLSLSNINGGTQYQRLAVTNAAIILVYFISHSSHTSALCHASVVFSRESVCPVG